MTHLFCPVCRKHNVHSFLRVNAQGYWRCSDCQCTFLEPAQRPDLSREHEEYRRHDNDIEDAGYRKFLSRVAEPLLAQLAEPSRGLDFGCGPGPLLAKMLSEQGHSVACYDPLFFPDSSLLDDTYQFITATEVVEHFHDPFAEFAKLDKMLAPGGWLGIMTCFQDNDEKFANWHYRRDPTHIVFYRPDTFEQIARRFSWRCHIPRKDVVLMQKLTEQ